MAVDDKAVAEALQQTWDDLRLHEVEHFVRDAGQRHDHLVRELEPHAWGGAEWVAQGGAALKEHGLAALGRGERKATGAKEGLDVLQGLRILVELGAEEAAEGGLGDVVGGGAEATGDDYRLAEAEAMAEVEEDVVEVVGDGVDATGGDAGLGEQASDGGGVGVGDLADEQLVADIEDGSFHGAKVQKIIESGSLLLGIGKNFVFLQFENNRHLT